jgi:hypothetical protein
LGNTLDNEENGPDGGSRRRPNDIMCVLAKCTIRVSGTVRVEMQKLDGRTEDEKKREKGNEQNASQGTRRPYFVAQRHD